MERTRAYRREVRNKAIARKKRIVKNVYYMDNWYPHDGQYSKGKIHCSCPLCAFGAYDKNQVTDSDRRKIEKMDSELKEFNNSDNCD